MRDIRSLRHQQNQRLFEPVRREIFLQLLSQVAYLNANNIIFARVEVRTPPQNVASDFVFADGAGPVLQGTPAEVQEDLPKLRGLVEVPAGDNPLDKPPPFVSNRDARASTTDGQFTHAPTLRLKWLRY
jgi:hypothetical protein